jgi:hypothetical protein
MTTGKWWGILQSFMFRLNNITADRFAEICAGMGLVEGQRPDIGVHIRLGNAACRQGQFAGLSVESIVFMYLQEVEKVVTHLRILPPASDCSLSFASSSSTRAAAAFDGESVWVARHQSLRRSRQGICECTIRHSHTAPLQKRRSLRRTSG